MKFNLYSALCAAALMCSGGYAQTLNGHAKVPFGFRMGDTVLPAGEYQIREVNGLLNVREARGKINIMQLTLPASRSTAPALGKLRFTRYGDEYYLMSIWSAGSTEGRALMLSKQQRSLVRHFSGVETAGIALKSGAR